MKKEYYARQHGLGIPNEHSGTHESASKFGIILYLRPHGGSFEIELHNRCEIETNLRNVND